MAIKNHSTCLRFILIFLRLLTRKFILLIYNQYENNKPALISKNLRYIFKMNSALENGTASRTLGVLKRHNGLSVRIWCVWSICQVSQHQQKQETLVGKRRGKLCRGSCFAAHTAQCEDSPESSLRREHTVRIAAARKRMSTSTTVYAFLFLKCGNNILLPFWIIK